MRLLERHTTKNSHIPFQSRPRFVSSIDTEKPYCERKMQVDTMREDDILHAADSILASRRRTKPCMNSPEAVSRYVREHALCLDRECFYVLTMNVKNRLIKMHLVALGTVCEIMVHPRDVFRPAIQDNSTSVIVAHNHPSGDSCPSEHDILTTKRLQECGKLLGVLLLDHVIVGDGEFYSFQVDGKI